MGPTPTRSMTVEECEEEIRRLIEIYHVMPQCVDMLLQEPRSRLQVLRKVCSFKDESLADILSRVVH
jgi:hypothetical protein